MHTVKNWSGLIKFNPQKICTPNNDQDIINIIDDARSQRQKIRPIGSHHSFSPLSKTNDILLKTDRLKGLVNVNKDEKKVTVRGGTKLHELGPLLFSQGYAQENMGDIDVQSVAGATATGTHGTGLEFGGISTQISAITFINGKGEKIYCNETENKNIFKAAQISLGLLGVITEIELKAHDAYMLELKSGQEDLDSVLQNTQYYNEHNRNFEFYWFPYTHTAHTRFVNKIESSAVKENKLKRWFDGFLENKVLQAVSFPTIYLPQTAKYVSRLCARYAPSLNKRHWSYKVYTQNRSALFNEMEYSVPYEAFQTVKKECIRMFEQKKFNVHMPTENRFSKSDDIYLSPSYGRNSAYIAFHTYAGTDYVQYFKTMEEVCVHHGGRPHWGKMHTRTAEYFYRNYPMWEEFLKIRHEMDPDKIFVTNYLGRMLFS